jgi:hypothetical protein
MARRSVGPASQNETDLQHVPITLCCRFLRTLLETPYGKSECEISPGFLFLCTFGVYQHMVLDDVGHVIIALRTAKQVPVRNPLNPIPPWKMEPYWK